MKIEIVEKMSKYSYYECNVVAANYFSIRKNPNKKISLFNTFFKILLILICMNIFWIVLYSIQNRYLNITEYIIQSFLKLCGIFLLFLFFLYINFKKIYKKCSNQKHSVVIDDIGIEQKVENKQDIIVKWEDLSSLIINKHSICVIPKHLPSKLIFLDIIHKEEFINAITQFNKQDLIIDNSNL